MSFFKKITIKVQLEDRDNQEVELYPIAIGRLPDVIEVQTKFEDAQKTLERGALDQVINSMCQIIQEHSNIPTIEDVKELSVGEIGFLFGKLVNSSQNPKV